MFRIDSQNTKAGGEKMLLYPLAGVMDGRSGRYWSTFEVKTLYFYKITSDFYRPRGWILDESRIDSRCFPFSYTVYIENVSKPNYPR